MAGIYGWLEYGCDMRRELGTAVAMGEAIAHRGHDNIQFFNLEGFLGQLQSRPRMAGIKKYVEGEEYTIVFDGTLYNAKELSAQLSGKRYAFLGSDAEIVLNAYIEFGAACLKKLNGVFSFAIYKSREKTLFAARDRIGVKPFFFKKYNGGFVFASEVKSLLKNPKCRAEVDNKGLKQIFLLGPARPMGETMYRGIKELKGGHYLTFDKNGLRCRPYWEIKPVQNKETLEEAAEHTRTLIEDATRRQLATDKSLGSFLSGGLDSSILSYIASEKFKQKNKTLSTVSIDYEGNEHNFVQNEFQPDADKPYIDIVSKAIGSRHDTIILKTDEVTASMDAAVLARDLPSMADIDSSFLLACSAASKKRFGVMLSGECADELFGGYPWYHKQDLLNSDTFAWSQSLDMRKNIVRNGVLKGDASAYVASYYQKTLKKAKGLDSDSAHDTRIRQMFMLNFYWFMQTLVDRMERLSSQTGLEMRAPFCDYRIVEYAYNLPWHIKAVGGREKGIIRKAFKGILPDKIVNRKKSPFPKTFDPLFVQYVKRGAHAVLSDKNSIVGEILNKQYVQDLLQTTDMLAQKPWYGQLMRLPQVLGYIMQLDVLFKTHNINLV